MTDKEIAFELTKYFLEKGILKPYIIVSEEPYAKRDKPTCDFVKEVTDTYSLILKEITTKQD
ncbi:hypothetical protein [Campylobacter concisus]|uniref:hypothetical protein n=1 Tax=Campylobacter concisus TaxID=199 RepID=UPI000D31E2BB|nr:hypothetical protein [Campylobacter concisus]